jgi:TonB family protein
MNALIRNEYPFPIAKAYMRTINAEEPVERFTQIGYLFEVTLKYLAAVSISEYLTHGGGDENVNKTLMGIKRPSLGHWVAFMRDTLRYNFAHKQTILSDSYFKKSPDYKQMAAAVNTINGFLTSESSSISSVSQEMFVNTFVNFRNKTKGHGAIQKRDCLALNQILFDGVEQYILSFSVFKDYELSYIRKIEFDKRRNYLYSLERLDGTDSVKTTYTALEPDPNVQVGHICVCKSEEGAIRPFLSLHPLFIFLDDKEDVYVLNESEAARMEYLCYHRGGRDAIYTPDELKEDFFERFGKILQLKDLASEFGKEPFIKEKPAESAMEETGTVLKPEGKEKPVEVDEKAGGKRPMAVVEPPKKSKTGIYAALGIVVVVLVAAVLYLAFLKPTDQVSVKVPGTQPAADTVKQKPQQGQQLGQQTTKPGGQPATTGQQPKPQVQVVEVPATYFEQVDAEAEPVGGGDKVYSYIDYAGLKMESGFQGSVAVRAYVNEKGEVDKTEIVRGIDSRFDNASMNAVKRLQFIPGKLGGRAVKSKTSIRIQFQGK